MLFSLYSYFRICFRHIQTYMSLVQAHTPNPGIFLSKSTFRLEGIFIIPYYVTSRETLRCL